jgi:flavodoxin
MKKLFIYYSLTGSGDLVASELKKQGYEIRKVISKYKYPKSFFWLMMTGGFKAGIGSRDKLIDFNNDISDYEEIVIGSPVWFDRVSPPINTVLKELDLSGKKVSFIFYSGSGEGNKASEKVKDIGDILIIKEPKKYKEELNKIGGFMEKKCSCKKTCKCGCQEGKKCTCKDCKCGCHEGKKCTCKGK